MLFCFVSRKKSKPSPDVILISSKRRLSGWSFKLKSKEKGKESIEMSDDESPNDSRLREKHAVLLRVAGFPRPHSDPCLSRQCGSELVNELIASSTLSDGFSESRSFEENDVRESKNEYCKENVKRNEDSADTNNIENYNALNGSANLIDLHKDLADVAGNISTNADFTIENENESSSGVESSTEPRGESWNLEQEGSVAPLIENSKETTNSENESCLLSSKYDLVMLNDMQHVKEDPDNLLSLEDELNAAFMGAPLDTIQVNQPGLSIDDEFDFTQSIEAVVETRLEEQKNVHFCKGDSEGPADVGIYQDSSTIGFDFQTGNIAVKYDQATGQITGEQSQCTDQSEEAGSVQTQLAESRSSRLRLFSQARGRNIIPELRTKLQSISFPSRSRSQRQTQKRQNNRDEGTGNGNGSSPHTGQKNRRRQCQTRIIEL